MPRVLIIDDDDAFRGGVAETARDLGYEVEEAVDCVEGRSAFGRGGYEAVILDHRLPDGDGLALLAEFLEEPIAPPIIMLTAFANSAGTVAAMRIGAFEHLQKPISRAALARTLERAVASRKVSDGPEMRAIAPATDEDVVGASEEIRSALKLVGMAAASDVTVLLTGETGVGKEIFAELLHRGSARAEGPYVAVNCAAVPAELIESSLFGHVKGAFSGATSDQQGSFRRARGGTLLLDEIGEMSLAMQAKILRVLETRRFTPVGAAREEEADVRVVVATHRDLDVMVEEGEFRRDLFHRLAVMPIRISPLRERVADIAPLARRFLHRFSTPPKTLSAAALALLERHTWPGNVRELRNAVERLCVVVRGPTIDAADIQPLLRAVEAASDLSVQLLDLPLPEALAMVERRKIAHALERSGGNRAEAARWLGIHRQLLYAKIKEYRLDLWGA